MPRPGLLRPVLLALVALVLLPLPSASARGDRRPDLKRLFAQAGTVGTMVVQERGGRRERTTIVDAPRSARRYLPSSTFKIPNSLLAIERGVASGADEPYPGPHPNVIVDGAPLLPAQCEGDLTLATAFRFSCIPIYQQIAREIGLDAYRRDLRALRYGNGRLDPALADRFWLEGPFAISAREQVRFLQRLRTGRLPLRVRTMDEVRRMMITEDTAGTVVRSKTGYVFTTTPRVGWWVGWVQAGERTWTFALNLDVTRPEHLAARTTIGRAILRELGAPLTG
ncbi:penicillin-binding transpeptidase domain-containing protein [Paraconexibacter algicola]|uniref:Beta-lactamase n=1 Tax=Paraconexibacter algicola TaxID=2133960 RepID=A0A2T4UEC0_9ACTN|nr:penicillin-binding transpeptidase domain-containing protein [Paraconexibacter algicola]PTL56121.1 class D beta-lactamase [Paraconexibacter algicola]